jgi:hypothetical protein
LHDLYGDEVPGGVVVEDDPRAILRALRDVDAFPQDRG